MNFKNKKNKKKKQFCLLWTILLLLTKLSSDLRVNQKPSQHTHFHSLEALKLRFPSYNSIILQKIGQPWLVVGPGIEWNIVFLFTYHSSTIVGSCGCVWLVHYGRGEPSRAPHHTSESVTYYGLDLGQSNPNKV